MTSGGSLPAITLPVVGGGDISLGKVATPGAWQIVIVYRGLHCPLCNEYLKRLEKLRAGFHKANAELIAISGDPLEKAQAIVDGNRLSFRVGYGLSIAQMRELGL